MSIITSASGSACWRGLEYYKLNKVENINMINELDYALEWGYEDFIRRNDIDG